MESQMNFEEGKENCKQRGKIRTFRIKQHFAKKVSNIIAL